MTDYQRGVEQASAVYQEVINEYVTENAKLRDLCSFLYRIHAADQEWQGAEPYRIVKARMEELGVEA